MSVRVFLALSACLLGGCDTVEFESPPQWPIASCDSRWVGDWRIENVPHDPETNGRQYLRVGADCASWRGLSLEPDDQGQDQAEIDDLGLEASFGFARTENQTFVVLRKTGETSPESDDMPTGYTLIAYEQAVDGSMWLQSVDGRKLAHLIIDDVVPGWIERRNRNPKGRAQALSRLKVLVFGDADDVRRILEAHDLLEPPWLRLEPADAAARADIARWLTPFSQPDAGVSE